jgi:hypothetical protein
MDLNLTPELLMQLMAARMAGGCSSCAPWAVVCTTAIVLLLVRIQTRLTAKTTVNVFGFACSSSTSRLAFLGKLSPMPIL